MEDGKTLTSHFATSKGAMEIAESSWSKNPLFKETKSDSYPKCRKQSTKRRVSVVRDDTKDQECESGFYESDSTTSDISKSSGCYSRAAGLPDRSRVQGANSSASQDQHCLQAEEYSRSQLLTSIINDASFASLEQEFANDLGQQVNHNSAYECDCSDDKELSPIHSRQLTSSRRSSAAESEISSLSCPSTIVFRRERDRYRVFKVTENQIFLLANSGFTEAQDLEDFSTFDSSVTDFSDEVTNDSISVSSSDYTFSLEELAKEFQISNEDLPEMRRSGLWITSQYDKVEPVGNLSESQAQIISARGTVRGVKNRVRNNIKNLLAASSAFERRGVGQDGQNPEHGLVVIYTTGLRLIRSTNLECHYVKQVFHNLMVQVDERDVLMNPQYKNELEQRLGTNKYTLPQVFIDGKHIGGAQEIEKLVETGQMKEYLQNTPRWDTSQKCERCGGYRYITCTKCFGSGKSRRTRISREISHLRCSACREGLIKCPDCDVANVIGKDDCKEESET